MRDPIKFRHLVGRELVCFLFGHKWIASHQQSATIDGWKTIIPAWQYKCRRCRLKINPRPPRIWYKQLFVDGIWRSLQAIWYISNEYIEHKNNATTIKSALKLRIAFWTLSIIHPLLTFCMAFDFLPFFIISTLSDIEYMIYVWIQDIY